MERKLVSVKKEGRVEIITMNNPPVNVIDTQLRAELRDCFVEAENDPEVGVLVITGEGKAFMAGADIKGFPGMVGNGQAAYDFVYNAYDVWFVLENLTKPTIAALNGLTLGAGLEMALCCDIRIADEKAKLGLPEEKLGLFPGGGGTQRLTKLIGKGKTKELIFSAEPVTAQQAFNLGIVEHVVPHGESVNEAVALGQKFAQYSAVALKAAKQAIDRAFDLPIRDGIEYEAQRFREVFEGEDIAEGVSAFLEKRTPEFHK